MNKSESGNYPISMDLKSGYTLLELMVSMSIFLVIVLPLLSVLAGNTDFESEKHRTVALSLIEEEYARIMLNPGSALQEKNVQAAGRQWVIKTEQTGGEGLTFFVVGVWLGNRKVTDAGFYSISKK